MHTPYSLFLRYPHLLLPYFSWRTYFAISLTKFTTSSSVFKPSLYAYPSKETWVFLRDTINELEIIISPSFLINITSLPLCVLQCQLSKAVSRWCFILSRSYLSNLAVFLPSIILLTLLPNSPPFLCKYMNMIFHQTISI